MRSIDIVALQAQHESAQMLYGAITVNKQNAGFDSGGSHKEQPCGYLGCSQEYTRASTCLWPYHRSTKTLFQSC